MSKALEYLQKARPDAVGAYFQFLKLSGTHLDRKTRALISVITKVDNQTEAGFKQYLSRALQAGASPDEVLDALLTAFPTLGLSKIIWAIDLILEMDLPDFAPDKLGSKKAWHEIGQLDQFAESVTFLEVDGKGIFVYRQPEEWVVYDRICPHQQTHLHKEDVSGNCIECTRHHWRFDLDTGECIEKGDRPLKRYPVKIEDNNLFAEW